MSRKHGVVVAAFALAGCATTFSGEAKVPQGRTGCEQVCAGWRMNLVGMVQMGEYSTGCICQVKDAPVSTLAAGAESAVVAVETERRRREAVAAGAFGGAMSGAAQGLRF